MLDDTMFELDAGEPVAMGLWPRSLPEHFQDLQGFRFEVSSRGDRVPGRLLLPAQGEGPFPLVLLQHGLGGSKDADYLDAAAGPWVRSGAAVASIDFPLHGERHSAKLTERVALAIVAARAGGEASPSLWIEFMRQAVHDLRRALDGLLARPEIDAERVAYASFSLGSIIGSVFCGVDPRPQAAALALGGGGFGPPEVDPVRFVGRIAPRPLLFVNTTEDQTIPRAWSEALHAAAGQPHRVEWFEGGHQDVPGLGLKAMWTALRPTLRL